MGKNKKMKITNPQNFPVPEDNTSQKASSQDHTPTEQEHVTKAKPTSNVLLYKNQGQKIENLFDQFKPVEKVQFEFNDTPVESQNNMDNLANSNNNSARPRIGSLENMAEDGKKDRVLVPTFGEEEFASNINRQAASSSERKGSNNSAKGGNKIDVMLEEHKKKKALQRVVELKKEVDSQANSPQYLLQNNSSPKFGSEPEEPQDSVDRYDKSPQNYDTPKSTAFNQQGMSSQKSLPMQGMSSQKSLPMQATDRLDKSSGFLNDMDLTESHYVGSVPETTPSKRTVNKKSMNTKTPVKSSSKKTIERASTEQSETKIPKISKTSRKIFESSQRARDDEAILEELYAKAAQNLTDSEAGDSVQYEDPNNYQSYTPTAKRYDPNSASSLTPSAYFRNHINITSISKGNDSANNSPLTLNNNSRPGSKLSNKSPEKKSPGTKSQFNNLKTPTKADSNRLNETNNSNKSQARLRTTGNNFADTPKSSKFAQGEASFMSNGSTRRAPPMYEAVDRQVARTVKVAAIKTVVEYKNKSRSPNRRVSTSPPSKESLIEWANTPKKLYLKVVNHPALSEESTIVVPGNHPIMKKSMLLQSLSLPKPAHFDEMTPEELEKYDEVQRIETMLRNLRKIQAANLMGEEYTGAKMNKYEASHFIGKKTSDYAEDINGSADGRRDARRRIIEEKLAREARSMPPYPMERANLTVDSLVNSMHLRTTMLTGEDEFGNLRSQRTESDQAKHLWECGVYERQMVWKSIKEEKTKRLARQMKEQQLQECTFSPTIFTKEFNPFNVTPWKLDNATGLLSTVHDSSRYNSTNPEDFDRMGAEISTMLKEKSLYQEKKFVDNYTDLNSIKKVYNLYKEDIFFPLRPELTTYRKSVYEPVSHRSDFNDYSTRIVI